MLLSKLAMHHAQAYGLYCGLLMVVALLLHGNILLVHEVNVFNTLALRVICHSHETILSNVPLNIAKFHHSRMER